MSLKKKIKKISVVALLALTTVPSFGQDLLARQAPVDHRMKSIDTLAVSHYRMMEDREKPFQQSCIRISPTSMLTAGLRFLSTSVSTSVISACQLQVALSQVTSVTVQALAANIKVWTSRFILATQSALPSQAKFAS